MKKNLLSFCMVLIAVTITSGCAVRNPYISPTTGDTAKIRVINQSDGTALLYASTSCQVASAKVIAAFSRFLKSDLSRVSMYGSQPSDGNKDVVERVIEAGKEMQIFTLYQGAKGLDTAQCSIEVAFTPKKDEQYEMTYVANSLMCSIAIDRLTETDAKIVRTKVEDVRRLSKGECR
ncbi:hypothetical protein [Herbaspirillum sp. 1130]|uniref:hypothetical protein n=1 Tax=Herbaspirillum sp. 1130 TaxID=2806562 RepID=UPI001AE52275|nr:hypothetical protein [Herbaspirillum sp. 1130]MBP1317793.1 hypothetical protein [Herbaspirillum sp. 1130]